MLVNWSLQKKREPESDSRVYETYFIWYKAPNLTVSIFLIFNMGAISIILRANFAPTIPTTRYKK